MKSALRTAISSGFTLIELLVVIAVMGVLATVVLVAVNPTEQFARADDANRKQITSSLADASNSYIVSRASLTTPDLAESATWIGTLQTAGEMKTVPPAISYTTAGDTCVAVSGSSVAQNGFCYNLVTPNFTIYTAMESEAEQFDSSGTACGANQAFFIYDSSTGKSCKRCGTPASFVAVPGNATTGCP